MKKKIIVVGLLPLNEAYKKRLFMYEFEKNKIEYEYWSLYYIFYKNEPVIYNRIIQKNEKIFKTKIELLNEIDKISIDSIFVKEGGIEKEIIDFYLKVFQKKIKIIFLKWGCTPQIDGKDLLKKRLKKLLNIKKVILHIRFLLKCQKLNWLSKYNEKNIKILYAGIKFKDGILKNKKIEKIAVMSEDLENYLKINDIEKEENQIVFLDQDLPNHPDFDILGEKKINSKKYYKQLNNFFDYIEKIFSAKIIIAAHPKSNYSLETFNGRKIVKNQTATEIKKSKLILASYSTTIGLGTIENKAIILIENNDFSEFMKSKVKKIAEVLDIIIINMDVFAYKNIPKLRINKEKYQKYYNEYLGDGINLKSAKDSILQFINGDKL
ncbi:hypothetical protein C4N20_01300 [Fusobacterium ulcerans]|uniref:Capsular biosynthesis protein n=1 Tax=Fusobacterium ulcerans TaxID=861 RepID=A0AAX2JDX3_9FUSO|nr:hypothetical protein [Fusobacterium ulcerans]AVQ26775.1 hypothetical protein C4N20_01300 [Fusobacterium ulcerans]EJZ44626.1 hypothetical protein FUAG_03217 [Fusobacterium ulcerans ATCC 49185]SQJ06907.1 Uncharacterised protein [Fusobacterium ulcerans]